MTSPTPHHRPPSMRALILAAGRGSRMGALTDERPKCLVELHGRPLLAWQLEALVAGGADEVGLVTGYRAEDLALRARHTFHNPRWADTNMVRTLACAAEWLREGPCLVSYADIVYSAQAVRALVESSGDLALTYDPDWLALWRERFADPLEDAETFRTDGRGRLLEIGARASSVDEIQGQFMGLLRFTPPAWERVEALLRSLPPDQADRLDTTALLSRLIAEGEDVRAVPAPGPWGEADSATDLAVLEHTFAAA